MSFEFNLKKEVLSLIHHDFDIRKAIGNLSVILNDLLITFSVESLSNEMLEKMLEHPRFLDIAMRKVGARIEYEHVLYTFHEFIQFTIMSFRKP